MKQRKPLFLTLFALLLLAALLLAPAVDAQSKQFFWERFDVDVQVLENGDLIVTENQTINFSGAPFTFGYRAIPIARNGNNDGIDSVEVLEGDLAYQQNNSERPGSFTVDESGGEAKITWYFEPALGSRRYTIRYRVLGGVRTEPSGDQVFWNAMPAGLGSSVAAGRVTMTLPEGIEAASTTALLGGQEAQSVSTQISEDGRRVTFDLAQGRPAGQDFEVGVRFPTGQIAVETPSWQRAEQIADVIGLIALIAGLIVAIGGPLAVLGVWYLRGRDPDPGVVPEYLAEPPADVPPAVVGTLIDETAHIHDIMSTLIDLARRGYLVMEQTGTGGDEYTFRRTDKETGDLRQYERTMLTALFKGKQERSLTNLRYKFAQNLPKIRQQLYEELVREGFSKSSPEGVRQGYGCAAVVVGVAAIATVFFLPSLAGGIGTLACPGIGLILTAAALFVVSRYMPAKSEKGSVAAAQWLAFKRYLQDIEKYTDLEAAKEKFEQYLPYAVAFGLERSWIRKFSAVPGTPIPPWYLPFPGHGGYYGGPVFGGGAPGRGGSSGGGMSGGLPSLEGMSGGLTGGLEAMSSGLTRMLNSTQAVLQSTPPSSTSGSGRSFGGGFSGGGFSGGFSGGSSGGGSGGFG